MPHKALGHLRADARPRQPRDEGVAKRVKVGDQAGRPKGRQPAVEGVPRHAEARQQSALQRRFRPLPPARLEIQGRPALPGVRPVAARVPTSGTVWYSFMPFGGAL